MNRRPIEITLQFPLCAVMLHLVLGVWGNSLKIDVQFSFDIPQKADIGCGFFYKA